MRNSFINPNWDESLIRDIGELKDSADKKEFEQLAIRLVDKIMPEGYDLSKPDDTMQELKAINAWELMKKEWEKICNKYADRETMTGKNPELEKIKIEEFRAKLAGLYSQEVINKFLNAFGLLKRKINRASHKKFLPDGSWISNGVRFGK